VWTTRRLRLRVIAFSLLAGIASSGAVSAASFTVNSTIDAVDAHPGDGLCATAAGECTLRAAVMEVNALPGVDTIELPAGTYTLTIPGAGEDLAASGDLDITDDVSIDGSLVVNGRAKPASVIDAAGLDRVIEIIGPIAVEMRGVILQNGDAATTFTAGGGIFNASATLTLLDSSVTRNKATHSAGLYNGGSATLTNVTISGNESSSGGGIGNGGVNPPALRILTLVDSVISDNVAGSGGGIFNGHDGAMTIMRTVIRSNHALGSGGGIDNIGDLSVVDTAIVGNTAPSFGGGIYHALGQATLERVSITGNAGTPGGGIDHGSGDMTVLNSTLSGNYSPTEPGPFGPIPGRGGAIFINFDTVDLGNVTIVGNRAAVEGGGIHNILDGTVAAENTILANNSDSTGVKNCTGPVISTGHNVEDAATCGLTGAGDISGVDPLLGPLADNGGPTQTHALLPGSPAIDAGDNSACPATDQRGVARPVDGNGDGVAVCDIGAFEASAGTTLPTPAVTPEPTAAATPGTLPAGLPRSGGRRW